jgi:hypothetical protein
MANVQELIAQAYRDWLERPVEQTAAEVMEPPADSVVVIAPNPEYVPKTGDNERSPVLYDPHPRSDSYANTFGYIGRGRIGRRISAGFRMMRGY